AAGVPCEIHQDIDVARPDLAGDLAVAKALPVVELIECRFNAPSHVGAVARPDRNAGDVKARPIVCLEQSKGEIGYGMLTKVCRKISDLDAIGWCPWLSPPGTANRCKMPRRPSSRLLQLDCTGRQHGKKTVRRAPQIVLAGRCTELSAVSIELCPVAKM